MAMSPKQEEALKAKQTHEAGRLLHEMLRGSSLLIFTVDAEGDGIYLEHVSVEEIRGRAWGETPLACLQHALGLSETKACLTCEKELPINQFSKDMSRNDGLCPRCKICERKRVSDAKKKSKAKRAQAAAPSPPAD